MLVGLPGMGMVAKATVNYFMDFLKPEFFADISVPYLSPSVACFDKGLVIPMDREISPFKFYYSRKITSYSSRARCSLATPQKIMSWLIK